MTSDQIIEALYAKLGLDYENDESSIMIEGRSDTARISLSHTVAAQILERLS
jgi:hypothetical protein